MESILPMESMMFELETATPTLMIPFMSFMDIVCELVLFLFIFCYYFNNMQLQYSIKT